MSQEVVADGLLVERLWEEDDSEDGVRVNL